MTEGAGTRPDLGVVVLSYRNDDTICAAIDSLLAQGEPIEIVVSHSGAGDTPRLVAERYPGVKIVASERRLLPGGARNAGVAATDAPYVAFLAADCVALPGWATGRLAHHRSGALAVGSALVPSNESVSALAYLARNSVRMPFPSPPRGHFAGLARDGWFPVFGLSYAQEVLARFGPFPESFAVGEDTAFNERLEDAGVAVTWAPDVITGHGYPQRPAGMLRDEYRRGRLRGTIENDLRWRILYALRTLAEPPLALGRALRRGSRTRRPKLILAAPLMLAAVVARALGILRAGREVSPALQRRRAAERRALIARVTKLHVLRALTAADVRMRFGRGRWRLLKWIAEPMAAVAVYLALVTFVLSRAGFAPGLTIACAVVPFNLLSAAVSDSLSVVARQRRLITSVAFDRRVLPVASALAQCVPFLVSIVLLGLPMAIYGIAPTWAVLLLPLAVAITALLGLALTYPAALFGLWFPELRTFVSLALRALFLLGAGIVALEQVPDAFSTAISLNPLTGLFEAYRSILVRGHAPEAWQLLYPLAFAVAVAAAFVPVYSREQQHFAKLLG